jgi:hypothetical protein
MKMSWQDLLLVYGNEFINFSQNFLVLILGNGALWP